MSYANPFSGTQSGQIILTLCWDSVYSTRENELILQGIHFLFEGGKYKSMMDNILEGLEDT